MTGYRTGDQVSATLTDTTGQTVTARLTIRHVDQLGCGCQRLDAARPGPDPGPSISRTVHLLTGCANGHDSDLEP